MPPKRSRDRRVFALPMIDLTLPMGDGVLSPPGSSAFTIEHRKTHDDDQMMSSRFCASTHAGTHVDAPLHFAADGRSVDELTLEECTGPADVFDLRQHSGEHITREMLERADPGIGPGSRVVLLTGDVDRAYTHEWDYPDDVHAKSAALTVDAAEWLVSKEVGQIANDFLTESMSVSDLPYDPDRPVHRTILDADISIVEYICNTDELASYDRIRFDCYPLQLDGAEAAPVRVVAAEM